MKKKSIVWGATVVVLLVLAIVPFSCDFTKPQKRFRLAIPETEYFHNYIAGHLKPVLERNGYQISIVPAATTTEANQMVADGKAELALVNNHSSTVARNLGNDAGQLRTIVPLATRLLFVFTRKALPDSTRAIDLFGNKKIGVESLGGETSLTLQRFMSLAKIEGTEFVTFKDSADVIVFWDRFYGERAASWLAKGYHPFSFKRNFIEFVVLNDHALREFKLPALPGDRNSIVTNTLATDVILVGNKNLGENACYLLAGAIYQNKANLMHEDFMYQAIRESFNKETLLFPLHQGTFSYILRDQPTFFERYAESLALGLSVLAVIYGAIQAVQGAIRRNRKERIDKYFLEFLEIRQDKTVLRDDRAKKLDDLFQRAVIQLTNEKLEKSDFHILSRLIQQDLTMLRFDK
jgi:TRAP-type uncharacterized transport system substrate-binding protein